MRTKALPSKTTTDQANKQNFERWLATLTKPQRMRFEGTVHRLMIWLSTKNLLVNQTTRSTIKKFIVECYDRLNKSNGHLALYSFYAWAQQEKVVNKNFIHIDEKIERIHGDGRTERAECPAPIATIHYTGPEHLSPPPEVQAVITAINKSTAAIIAAIERQTSTLAAAARPAPQTIPEIRPPELVNVTDYLASLPAHEQDTAEMAIDRFKTYVRKDLDTVTSADVLAFFNSLRQTAGSARVFQTVLRHIEKLYRLEGPMKGLEIMYETNGDTGAGA